MSSNTDSPEFAQRSDVIESLPGVEGLDGGVLGTVWEREFFQQIDILQDETKVAEHRKAAQVALNAAHSIYLLAESGISNASIMSIMRLCEVYNDKLQDVLGKQIRIGIVETSDVAGVVDVARQLVEQTKELMQKQVEVDAETLQQICNTHGNDTVNDFLSKCPFVKSALIDSWQREQSKQPGDS